MLFTENEIRVSDLMGLPVTELKNELRRRREIISGNKEILVGRLLKHASYHNISIVNDVPYVPTKEDKQFGIVSNLPWKFQNKVCIKFADSIVKNHPVCFDSALNDENSTHKLAVDPESVFRGILLTELLYSCSVSDETALYLGYTQSHHYSDTWEWKPDEEGRVFVDILSKLAAELWREAVIKHRMSPYFGDPYTDYVPFPFIEISEHIGNIIPTKQEKVYEQRKLRNIIRSTFLYGCAIQNSGATYLPLIGARYAYGPIRKQISEYVGVTNV